MDVRPLRRADVPAATRLSSQVGWNQLPADWHRFLDLDPEGCHAGWVDDELVATATVVAYEGRVGWLGMVLVDEAHRRQGYGSTIFRHALTAAIDRGIEDLGLDATDAGRAVYSKIDFVDVAPIERWGGSLDDNRRRHTRGADHSVDGGDDRSVDGGTDRSVEHLSIGDLDIVATYDRDACGVDRRALLEGFLAMDESCGFVVPGGEGPRGYALLRPGRLHWHLGPIVAADEDVLSALLAAAADRLDGASVIVDPLVTPAITRTLARHGLERQRRLTRMVYGRGRPLLMGEAVVAAAGFEWG